MDQETIPEQKIETNKQTQEQKAVESSAASQTDPTDPTPSTSHLSPLIWLVGALFLVFLLVGGFFLYKQAQYTPEEQVVDTLQPSPSSQGQTTPVPTTDELAVPSVSDATDLETIEEELNSLKVASPESDLDSLDADASQL